MFVGAVRFDIYVPGAASLKDRRRVLRSLIDRLRGRFNAAVADLSPDGVWGRAEVAVACVSGSMSELEGALAKISEYVEREADLQVVGAERFIY